MADRKDGKLKTYAGPETWAMVRESYLNGVSARVLAKRYGLNAGTIWKKAQRNCWTRQDKVETPPPALPPLFGPESGSGQPPTPAGPVNIGALLAEAADGSARAMRQGRLDEAQALAKLAESYGRLRESLERASKLAR